MSAPGVHGVDRGAAAGGAGDRAATISGAAALPGSKLYYTIGDQGANRGAHFCNPNWAQRLPAAAEVQAQNWAAYQGKTLRLNLDGSVPVDNPVLKRRA